MCREDHLVVGKLRYKVRFDMMSGCAAACLEFDQGAGRQKSSAAQLLLQKVLEADHCILSLLG